MKPIRTKAAMSLTVAMLLGAPGLQATAPAPAAPAAAGDDMSLADLLNIKLQTGSFLELDLAKSPLSMTIIDREKIDMAGANHLSELLEIYVPGFQYMYNKWNGVLWGMRGVTNDRNTKFIVLVNGHKLNTESRDGFMQETAMGLFGDVERIEVLRGPAGLVYGSGAIAGVINIVTREVTKTGGELTVKGRAWTTGFGNTAKSIQGTVFGKISDVQSFRASLGMEQSDGVGMHVSQLMGVPSWPSPGILQPGGSPSNGSVLATPGNWKADADWKYKDFRLYTRFTHQVQEGSGHFARQPWPYLVDAINRYNGGGASAADSLALSQAPKVWINGRQVSPTDPYWSGTAGGGTNNRREYIADGISLESNLNLNIGENQLKLRAGVDGITNKIGVEELPGYDNSIAQVQNIEDFGERRYTLAATYLMKTIPKLQLAVGAEQRLDDLGDGLDGNNMENEVPLHKTITPMWYSNTAIFSEGYYDVNDRFSVDAGVRYDAHTRTIDQGGTLNGKLAGIYTPAQGHSVKLIFQSSSNNGAVDNYEPNRFQMDDKGVVLGSSHFQTPANKGDRQNNQPVPGVTTDLLHKLKPEKVYSFELTSTDDFGNGFMVSPSISYNIIQDLFIWNQPLLRVVNAGGFNSMNIDLEGSYKNKWIEVGANHTAQFVVNTDLEEQATLIPVDFVRGDTGVQQADGTWLPTPAVANDTVNPVHDAITVDGTNFLSLSTHTTKLFANYKPTSNITLHTDVRVFWALAGRDSSFSANEKQGFEFMNLSRDPSIKWNASAHFALPSDWTVSLFVYDILGVNDYQDGGALATNTLRWQQAYSPGALDIFTQDLRSYAIELKKAF